MPTDKLVDELLDDMHSYVEECICPFCEGHGAMSQARAVLLKESLPPPIVTGIETQIGYSPEKRATLLNFRVNGTFGAEDAMLFKSKDWNEVEGELRTQFENLVTQLHKAFDEQTIVRKLKRDEEDAKRHYKPNDISPKLSGAELDKHMAAQNALLKKLQESMSSEEQAKQHEAIMQKLAFLQQQQTIPYLTPPPATAIQQAQAAAQGQSLVQQLMGMGLVKGK
jgi:hypothetical protein